MSRQVQHGKDVSLEPNKQLSHDSPRLASVEFAMVMRESAICAWFLGVNQAVWAGSQSDRRSEFFRVVRCASQLDGIARSFWMIFWLADHCEIYNGHSGCVSQMALQAYEPSVSPRPERTLRSETCRRPTATMN